MPPIDPIPGVTVTVRGITARVLIDGFEKGVDPGTGPWRKILYEVDWDQSDDFMDALMGVTTSAGGPGGMLIFPGPHAYPGNTRLKCADVSAVGKGPGKPDSVGGKLLAFDGFAHVVATYRVPPWDALGDDSANAFGGQPIPYASFRTRSGTDKMPLPQAYVEKAGGDPFGTAAHLDVPVKDYIFIRHQIPFRLDDFLDPLVGKVNLTTFWGKPAESIKLEEYDQDEETDSVGNKTQRLEVRLAYRGRYNWNQVPGVGLTPVTAQAAGGGAQPLYPKAEFNVFPFTAYP